MSLTHPLSFVAGVATLLFVWVVPPSRFGVPPFSSHMLVHMVVVAVAAPLLVLGIAESRFDPVRRFPVFPSAVLASAIEFLGVWCFHVPRLHDAARSDSRFLVAEQLTFFCCGVFLWTAAFGGTNRQRVKRSLGGVLGLLLTSMHMTLLGALIALSKRPLYAHAHEHGQGVHSVTVSWSPIVDQQVGGAIMLFLGAGAYLAGGVALGKELLSLRESKRTM